MHSSRRRRWTLPATLSLGLFVLVLCAAGCSPPQPPLRLGSNPWPGYLPPYYARHLGLLDRRQLQLVDFDTNEDVIRALRNGAIDLAALTLDESLLVAGQGAEFVILMPFDVSEGGDSLLARPPIEDIHQLRGKRLGVETNALGAYFLARMLQRSGLKASDLDIINLALDNQEKAYRDGRVDAVITFEPARSRILAAGAREIFSSRRLPGEIVDVLVGPRAVVESRGSDLRTLLNAHYAALRRIKADPAAAAAVLAPRTGLTADVLLKTWELMRLPDATESEQLLAGLPQQIERLQRILRDTGLLLEPVDSRPQVDRRLLEALTS